MDMALALVTVLVVVSVALLIKWQSEAKQRLQVFLARNPKLVDVRTGPEFASEHIGGAVNIPVDELASRIEELGLHGTPIGLYCKSGARASVAELTLIAAGFTNVMNLGGISAVRAALKRQ